MRSLAAGLIVSALCLHSGSVFAQTDPTAPPPATSPPPPAAPPPTSPPPYAGGTTAPSISASGGSASLKGLSLWGILPWGGYGAGARFMLPLGLQPLLGNTNLRDSFALEFGADLLHWSYDYALVAGSNYSWTEVLPVVGVMWNVWLTENFAVYPKVELGYAFGWFSDWNYGGTQPTYGGLFADGAAGILYKMNNGLTLRVEGGYAGLKLGAGWLF